MDIAAIRAAAAEKLAVLQLHPYAYAPDLPTVPAFYIFPQPFDYDATYDGDTTLMLVVRYLVSSVNSHAGQNQLDGLIAATGSTSAKVKLEADPTLNGTCKSVRVTAMRNYGSVDIASLAGPVGRYFSAEQLVVVYA